MSSPHEVPLLIVGTVTFKALRLLLIYVSTLIMAGLGLILWSPGASPHEVTPHHWEGSTRDFDVVVVGSEPEGIIAAVAAAQEGARTLLVTRDDRLGGLFVKGEMNSLDLRTQPELYQQGLFEGWWDRVGRGSAFDVTQAERAFEEMLAEARVTVLKDAMRVTPKVRAGRVVALQVDDVRLYAEQFIDATSEADVAAAAGADYTVGFASIGLHERMADTLVFRLEGIDWQALTDGIQVHGANYAAIDEHAAWGHFGGYPAAYQAKGPGLRLRGLNLGLQADGSVLVNALLIYGIEPFDPKSVAAGKERAMREAPRIVAYLRSGLPGFDSARFGGVAEVLYVRETRHLEALCQLTVDDVLDNVVTEQDVAAGGYPLDVQTLTPHDDGYVFGKPDIYGVRLCVTIPRGVDGLWVVGKAAGYDPLAASSARVVPFGMALAEAVGVAATQTSQAKLSPAAFVKDKAHIVQLRARLEARGAYLPKVKKRAPVGPYQHPHYHAFRFLLRYGLAVGGYDNDPALDEKVSTLSFIYMLSNLGKRALDAPHLGDKLIARYPDTSGPLSPQLAFAIIAEAACQLGRCPAPTKEALDQHGLIPPNFSPSATLTRGEIYALGAQLTHASAPLETAERQEP